MNLDDIQASLPNGFHDAILESVRIDYMRRNVEMFLNLWVGDLTSEDRSIREQHRQGVLTISDFNYYLIEAPDPSYPYARDPGLTIDGGPYSPGALKSAPKLPTKIPEGMFQYWFFVNEWNSFIHVCARDAGFKWTT
jgi:hypothetical protein